MTMIWREGVHQQPGDTVFGERESAVRTAGVVRTWVRESTTIVRYCTSLRRSRCALLVGPAYPNTSSTFLHALPRAVVGRGCV